MKCYVWSVTLYGVETSTLRRRRNERKQLEAYVDVEKDGAYKLYRQNKKCSCGRKNGRRKNNAGTDKEEEKKLAGKLAKKDLPAEGCCRRNGEREESSRQKKISDAENIVINGLYEDTKKKG